MFDALRKLDVWRRSCRVSVEIYKLLEKSPEKTYRDQLSRSALSIASNIAEGYERETIKDRIRFLSIAKGSCGECWTQLLIGMKAGFVSEEAAEPIRGELEEIAKMIRGLIVYLENHER